MPQARLELWGFGKEADSYRRLIAKWKLGNHVFVKGFAYDVTAVFQRAAFSVVTSKSEAFSMAILESLAVGTPVISYHCPYGPIDLIQHDKNGIAVEPNDVKCLAKAMITLFHNQKKCETFSREALKSAEKYSRKTIAQKWVQVFDEALIQKNRRVKLQNMTASFTHLIYVPEEKKLIIQGELDLQQNQSIGEMHNYFRVQLRMRKEKRLADLYYSLDYSWVTNDKIIFYASINSFPTCSPGLWAFLLEITCLNECKFVTIKGKRLQQYESRAITIGKLKFKFCIRENGVFVKVPRSPRKERFHFRAYRLNLTENYKQRLKTYREKVKRLKL